MKSKSAMRVWLVSFLLTMSVPSIGQSGGFTFVFLNKKSNAEKIPKDQSDKLMEGHMANITRLASEGKLIAAGPFDGGGGIFVFNSNSIAQVQEWVSTDPAVKANRWNVEILPYSPMIGSICKVGEPYEMVSYHFIRFWPQIKKFNVEGSQQLILAHEDYWKKQHEGKPHITFASFGVEAGDILILGEPIDESVLMKDPAIGVGLMKFEKKVLWIARGSFCEKTEK